MVLGATRASGEPVVIRYQAPSVCPGRDAFLAEVRARTARAEVVEAAAERSFVVTVAPLATGGFMGRVQVGGGERERTFSDDHCAEVASALALVVALAIDPDASTTPLASGAPAAPASAAPATSAPVPAASSATVAPRSPPASSAPSVRVELPYRAHRWHSLVGVQGAGILGPGPRALVGGGVFGEVASTSERVLSLAVRLGLVATVVAPTEQAGDRARARLVGGRLDVCAVRLRAGGTGQLDLCVASQAGGLRGEGIRVAQPTGSWRSWVAVGGAARARHTTRRGFFVEAEVGLLAPLTHDPLVLTGPLVTVYTPPAVVVPFAIGVGLDFL